MAMVFLIIQAQTPILTTTTQHLASAAPNRINADNIVECSLMLVSAPEFEFRVSFEHNLGLGLLPSRGHCGTASGYTSLTIVSILHAPDMHGTYQPRLETMHFPDSIRTTIPECNPSSFGLEVDSVKQQKDFCSFRVETPAQVRMPLIDAYTLNPTQSIMSSARARTVFKSGSTPSQLWSMPLPIWVHIDPAATARIHNQYHQNQPQSQSQFRPIHGSMTFPIQR